MNLKDKCETYFSIIKDIRKQGYIKYKLSDILFMVMCATLCGCETLSKIVEFCEERLEYFNKYISIDRVPCESTISLILSKVDPFYLSVSIVGIMKYVLNLDMSLNLEKERQVAIDGKAVKSTATMKRHDYTLYIVTAMITDSGICLGQLAVEDKSNEIPAVRELLDLIEVKNTLISLDAMHCQKETVKDIIEKEGNYLIQLKANQANFYEDVKLMFDDTLSDKSNKSKDEYEKYTTIEKSHGRIEKRTCYVLKYIEWFAFKEQWSGLKSIFAIKREVEKYEEKSSEWSYYISSKNVTAEKFLEYTRKHWQIESMHWILDVNFLEDDSKIQDKIVLQNLNVLKKISIQIHKNYINNLGINKPISRNMFKCLMSESYLDKILMEI